MARVLVSAALAAMLLGACAAVAPARGADAPTASPGTAAAARGANVPHFRCDEGFEFDVRFGDDSAVLDAGAQGKETLLRDAGGATPQQSVYSNLRLRAEFGLGTTARESLLHYAAPPRDLHCVQQ